MTHLIIGTDDVAIAALRSQLREDDPVTEIQLKSARDFDKDHLSDAPKVYVVGDFPEIVAAYGDRIQNVKSPEVAEIQEDEVIVSKRKSK